LGQSLLPRGLSLSEPSISGVSATVAVEAPKLGGRPIFREFSNQNVGVIVNFPVLVPRVNGGTGGVALVSVYRVQGLLSRGLHRGLGFLRVALGAQADLLR
jgi:hypothetical protein